METANRRYGFAPGRARENQACTNGLVDEISRYGSPTVAVSRSRIREIGSLPPSGFQDGSGRIGSVAAAAASRIVCRIACPLGPSLAEVACAYA